MKLEKLLVFQPVHVGWILYDLHTFGSDRNFYICRLYHAISCFHGSVQGIFMYDIKSLQCRISLF